MKCRLHVADPVQDVQERIGKLGTSDKNKALIGRRASAISKMQPESSEHVKASKWLEMATSIPFGKSVPVGDPTTAVLRTKSALDSYLHGMKDFKEEILTETGMKPDWAAGSFEDLDEDVRQSIQRIITSPFIPFTDHVRGFVYDVATGRLREVAPRS